MPTVPVTREAILAAIAEDGPMTAAELTEATGKTRRAIDASINAMREHGTKFLRITSYRRQRGRGGREATVYGLGPGPDAKRPALDTPEEAKARQARYREKNRTLLRLRMHRRRRGQVNPFLQLIKEVA